MTIHEVEEHYGPVRRRWPREVLRAAAPYDALAQLALGHTPARRVYTRPPQSALHPHDVRPHRPHETNAGIDWRPVLEPDDGGASWS